VAVVAVVLFAAAALFVPFGIPERHFVWRTVAAYLAIGSLLRFIEVARDPAAFRPAERLAIVLFLTDPRQVRRVPRRVLVRTWLEALVLDALGAVGLYLAHVLSDGAGPFGSVREIERSVVGGAALLVLSEGTQRLFDGIAALFGAALAPVHAAPNRSQSLSEFWGRRWNLVIGGWLRAHCYAPLARLGFPRAGVLAAFMTSAFIHVYPTFVAIGVGPAAAIAGFFLVHGALMIVEARLRMRRWRLGGRLVYVYGAFAVTAPLFTEAFMRSMGL
jgi:hypothetical protein